MNNVSKKDNVRIPLVLATRNRGKLSEIKALLSEFDVDVMGLDDFGPIPEIEEDGKTFEDNAYKKAYQTARMLGFPSLADDSGLVVNALDGQPGIYSARYAGENSTDEDNNQKLLHNLSGVQDRTASFFCVIAIAVPDGPALIYEGICEGMISEKRHGNQGFGYDPLFYYPPLKKTFAQLSEDEKNRISHRGKAMAELKNEFNKVLIWLRQRLEDLPA